MRPRIDLRFRPSLLIFIEETGRRICEQFKAILSVAGLDRVLWQGIALLQCTADSARAVPLEPDAQEPGEERTIEQLVEQALRDVQSSRRIGEIIAAGYPVPNPRTQIYIVGEAAQEQTARVHRLVEEQLARMGCHTLVCFVLHAEQVKQETARNPALEMAGAGPACSPQAGASHFCYLYSERLTYPIPAFISRAECHYAAAEALFALVATGLTTEPFFEEAVRGGTGPAAYAHPGCLGTSLIRCPQEALREYCSVHLSIEMVDHWLRDVRDARPSPSRRRQVQEHACSMLRALEEEIRDTRERPLANEARRQRGEALACIAGRSEPGLDMLTRSLTVPLASAPTGRVQPASLQEAPDLYRHLYGRSRALFALFWPRQVRRDYKRQRSPGATWSTFVSQRAELAAAAYAEWDETATRAWDAATQHLCADLQNGILKLCAEDEAGLGLATVSIDEIEDRLVDLRANLRLWHRAHVQEYQTALRLLAGLADGPWAAEREDTRHLDEPAGEDEQTEPVKQASLENTPALPPASEPDAGYIPSLGPLSPQFSEQEARIVRSLERRIGWREQRVPSGAAQIIAAVPFVIAVLLMLFSFTWRPQTTAALALVSAVVIGLVVAGYGAFYGKRVWAVRQAREDLLTFYRRYCAYLCEQREDRLRLLLLNIVQSKALGIRQRLDHMMTLLEETHAQFTEQAGRIPCELFQGASSSRDVFVVNGEMLQQGTGNTLDDAVEQVTKQRALAPVEPWHATTQALSRRFVTEMGERLFSLSQEEFQQRLLEWSREVTHAYCRGPLVDLSAALDRPEVWREALERAKQVLSQTPQWSFVCGRDADTQRGTPYLPGDVYPVRISGAHAWMLVAAFARRDVCPDPDME